MILKNKNQIILSGLFAFILTDVLFLMSLFNRSPQTILSKGEALQQTLLFFIGYPVWKSYVFDKSQIWIAVLVVLISGGLGNFFYLNSLKVDT